MGLGLLIHTGASTGVGCKGRAMVCSYIRVAAARHARRMRAGLRLLLVAASMQLSSCSGSEPCASGYVGWPCEPCGPGTYQFDALSCEACPAATYADESANALCKPCRPWDGEFSAAGAAACSVCPAGSFLPRTVAGGVGCQLCAVGTFSLAGASECTAEGCPVGHFFHPVRAQCVQCAPGSFKNTGGLETCRACKAGSNSASGASSCACRAGFEHAGDGSGACTACAPGSFRNASAGANSACAACAPGTFAARAQSAACLPCPAGFYALAGGNSMCDQCWGGRAANAERTGCVPGETPCGSLEVRVAGEDLPSFVRVDML